MTTVFLLLAGILHYSKSSELVLVQKLEMGFRLVAPQTVWNSGINKILLLSSYFSGGGETPDEQKGLGSEEWERSVEGEGPGKRRGGKEGRGPHAQKPCEERLCH